jgi:hypothetical protein
VMKTGLDHKGHQESSLVNSTSTGRECIDMEDVSAIAQQEPPGPGPLVSRPIWPGDITSLPALHNNLRASLMWSKLYEMFPIFCLSEMARARDMTPLKNQEINWVPATTWNGCGPGRNNRVEDRTAKTCCSLGQATCMSSRPPPIVP